MPAITPSWTQVHPSYVMPEFVIQFTQASGYLEAFYGANIQARLGDGDLYAYLKQINLRTQMAAGQAAFNQLPSVDITTAMLSIPSYSLRVRAEYDHHDTAAASNWGFSLDEALRLGGRQGHFQLARSAGLYGINGANGEGLLNTPNATTISLPADSNGNTTIVTYDNGQMAFFLTSLVSALKTRTLQLGMAARVVFLGPQRVLGNWEYQDIVQVTQFQRTGAGSMSTAGVVKAILEMNGDEVDFCYDDTLIGKGSGGTDAILVVLPELKKPNGGKINTNEFAKLTPGLDATTMQLCDMAAPMEIPTPLAGGAIDKLMEWRITPGWGIRSEAITILSAQYQ